MCGICGFVRRGGMSAEDTAVLEQMNATLTHRGPDSTGFAAFDRAGLAMSRLSIIDVTGGDQPIWNEDRTLCIVYNGELYNFLDLRPELEARGHRFATRCDTEVILHAYEEWGANCLRRLNGMFAMAIWDTRRRELFLARDRIGEKPLYYYHDAGLLVFASEIKAILQHPAVPRCLDPCGLANYLTFGHAVAPRTMYQGIAKLLPGHYLIVSDAGMRTARYWDVGDEPQLPTGTVLSENEYAQQILSLLDDSVRRRMIADVPLGAFLSGGVDSSAIVALMKRHASGPVKTFSLGFNIGGAYNELSDAAFVAQRLGTEHHELHVDHTDLIPVLKTLIYHYDEPFGDEAAFPVYLLSRFAREHVKVVLTGDGGDELFGGYRRYAADALAPIYGRLPSALTADLVPALAERLPRLRRIKRTLNTLPIRDPGRRYAAWLQYFSPDLQAELLQPDMLAAVDGYDPVRSHSRYYASLNGSTANDHLNRLLYVDFKTLLVDAYMEKTDKASMAASLEARLPLLDHRLVELAFQIPGHFKIRGWSTKRILKRAVQGIVPSEVLRKPKHGFAVPTDPWFRGSLKSFAFDVLLDESTKGSGYFNPQVVERLWREHAEGRAVRDTQLWLLLNFELWRRTFLAREPV